MDSAQGSDLVPIFWDWSQSEKLSEVKPPLIVYVRDLNLIYTSLIFQLNMNLWALQTITKPFFKQHKKIVTIGYSEKPGD